MTLIPEFMLNLYRTDADKMIDELGQNCKIIYPPVKSIPCENCQLIMVGGSPQNHYRNGGPAPFYMGKCPLCGGSGFKPEQSPEDIIKLRVNYEPKTWLKMEIPVQVPDGSVQVIGSISNIPKINKSVEIIINNATAGYVEEKYQLAGEAIPHGFQVRNYFIAILKRV